MPYSKFESIEEVARKFDLEVRTDPFISKAKIKVPESCFARLQVKLADSTYFINEYAVCEHIITPILDLVIERYKSLRIWSRVAFNVDQQNNLTGEPDYLIAPKNKYGGMLTPPLCIMEAKKEKFDEGWAQTLAELVAASIQGASIGYGVVTNGKIWEFGKLEKQLFIKDPGQISATRELQEVLDMLNWLFREAEKLFPEIKL